MKKSLIILIMALFLCIICTGTAFAKPVRRCDNYINKTFHEIDYIFANPPFNLSPEESVSIIIFYRKISGYYYIDGHYYKYIGFKKYRKFRKKKKYSDDGYITPA